MENFMFPIIMLGRHLNWWRYFDAILKERNKASTYRERERSYGNSTTVHQYQGQSG